MDEDIELYVCSASTKELHIYTSSNLAEVHLEFWSWALTFINDTSYAVGGDFPPSLQIRRKDDNELIQNIDVLSEVSSLSVSTDGRHLCVGMWRGLFVIVQIITVSITNVFQD